MSWDRWREEQKKRREEEKQSKMVSSMIDYSFDNLNL